MPDNPIKFGTDGWRAVIAREFTFANVERVAQAYADYLASEGNPSPAQSLVIVGYDRRFHSENFAQRAAEILTGNGFPVAMFDEPAPTPLVSWAVKDQRAVGGVMITASHNPPEFNGFKIKAPWGGSASPETTSAVEKLVDTSPLRRRAFPATAPDERLQTSIASYRAQIESYVDVDRLKQAPHSVIIDPMHGSGGRWVETFLQNGRLKVETIRAGRDPMFGGVNPEPIDRNLAPLKDRVTKTASLVGLATDGDADRVGAVNERGETMTMHEVVPLLLLHFARERKMTGGVVRTFSQSVLTKRIADAFGLKVYETPIGFKYVADLMLNQDILVGAEESGGIGVKGHIPERDGVLNSLLLLEAIVTAGKGPSEMVREMHREFGEFYFGRRDLRMEVKRGQELVQKLADNPPARLIDYQVSNIETVDGTKLLFEDETWLLFRQSGTEPVLRVYCEATSVAKMNALLDEGEKLAQGNV
ncbi:MAG: phosphoglucomutase/phosphomannomutase family protein [Pyrinomonadaceae bacterium]